jgi:hypothetical protein
MSTENKQEALRFSLNDLNRLNREGVEAVDYAQKLPSLPNEGGRALICITIGFRGDLSKTQAHKAAAKWKEVIAQYPKAIFYPNLLGYDEDPREIWDIADAARYVRRWARYAGINSPGDIAVELHLAGGIGFLAACGCFGDALKARVLAQHRKDYGAPVMPN